MPNCCFCFLEQEALLTLFQSIQLYNGDLAIAGEENAKLCMSHLMVEVLVGPRVPTPSSMRHVQPSCGTLVPSPGAPTRSACLVHRHRRDRVSTAATGFASFECMCVVCVCVCVRAHVCV